VGWEPSSDRGDGLGTLEVQFHSGHVYQYADVPEVEYQALIGASSVGKYLNENIVDRYDVSRHR
jgi:hypothetical protein